MAATLSIPLYLSVGSGSEVEIGEVVLTADSDGTITMTTTDIAAGLREAADAIERAGQEEETPDAPA